MREAVKKVTVSLPAHTLENARRVTGKGITPTIIEGLHEIEQPARLWDGAGELGSFLGRRGARVKSRDLLIAAYALAHGVPVLTGDADFARMKRAGADLLLAGR